MRVVLERSTATVQQATACTGDAIANRCTDRLGAMVVTSTNCCTNATNTPANGLLKCFYAYRAVSEPSDRKYKGALPRQWAVCR